MSNVEKQIEQWRDNLAGSELLGRGDIHELESHLREEMEHLQAAGLAADEAFLVARCRLGDTAALEQEFAKVSPHRRLAQRLYWMVLGMLSWFVVWPLGNEMSVVAAYLAYLAGLRGTSLSLFALATSLAGFGLTGFLVLRYLASHWHARLMARGMIVPLAVGACAAGVNWFLCWGVNFTNHHVWRYLTPTTEVYRQIAQPMSTTTWYVAMMFLFAAALAVFARLSRDPAAA